METTSAIPGSLIHKAAGFTTAGHQHLGMAGRYGSEPPRYGMTTTTVERLIIDVPTSPRNDEKIDL